MHRTNRRMLLGAMWLLAFCVIPSSYGLRAETSRLDQIIAAKTLRVGTTGDYRPFSFLNPSTKGFEGIDIELARSLAKSLGVEAEFVQTAWPNLMSDFQANKFDMAIGGVSVTLDRARVGLFSIPIMVDGKTPIARCADKERFQSLIGIDRPDVRAIVNPGGTNERFARANLIQAQLSVFPDNVTIFQQIVDGKADVMITDASETRLQQKLHPELCAIHPEQPFTFAEKAVWLQRDAYLKAYVDQWLNLVLHDGTYAAITKAWLE
ncbi:MAG: transporter substrate-binding domain-containing protein [Proteobacteria bacterium]|nr:transporter substrate-binding domain-containing protein [Pseudomonadota bacterium]